MHKRLGLLTCLVNKKIKKILKFFKNTLSSSSFPILFTVLLLTYIIYKYIHIFLFFCHIDATKGDVLFISKQKYTYIVYLGIHWYFLVFFLLQSWAYQFGYSLFKDSEETIHSAGINATSYEPPWFFSYRKTKKKNFLNNPITKNQKPKN